MNTVVYDILINILSDFFRSYAVAWMKDHREDTEFLCALCSQTA